MAARLVPTTVVPPVVPHARCGPAARGPTLVMQAVIVVTPTASAPAHRVALVRRALVVSRAVALVATRVRRRGNAPIVSSELVVPAVTAARSVVGRAMIVHHARRETAIGPHVLPATAIGRSGRVPMATAPLGVASTMRVVATHGRTATAPTANAAAVVPIVVAPRVVAGLSVAAPVIAMAETDVLPNR